MSNDENKFQPIFQILHIKSAWFLLELAMALVTTIGMRFLQVCNSKSGIDLPKTFWIKKVLIYIQLTQGLMRKMLKNS